MKRDLAGRQIIIGDHVAVSVGGKHHDFYIAEVERFTPEKVVVKAIAQNRSWNNRERIINPMSCVKIDRILLPKSK